MKVECDTCKRNVERNGWRVGPWSREPNVKWFEHAGLACIVHRGPSGAWCGYVGVEENHPYHGKSYDELDEHPEVHGGLTYGEVESDRCISSNDGKKRWWFGFDCAHGGDLCPAFNGFDGFPGDVYRTMDYAISETKFLAEQIVKGGAKNG